MSEHFDANQIDEAKDSEQLHRTPGPALPIISLVASIAGAAIGYYINWPVGVVLVITSIVCGILARKLAPRIAGPQRSASSSAHSAWSSASSWSAS